MLRKSTGKKSNHSLSRGVAMNNRRSALAIAVMGSLLLLGPAVAQDPRSTTQAHGLEVGARVGYGIPFGTAENNGNFSDAISGMIPLWGDLGYRFTPHFYFGAFFMYGPGFVSSNAACSGLISCSTNDMRFGINLHYHFAPAEAFDPWIGIGGGYEIWKFNTTFQGASFSGSLKGWEFGNVQVGLDFRGGPNFAVGPFASFSVSQFSKSSGGLAGQPQGLTIQNKGIHEWFIFGLRCIFDLGSQ